MLLLLRFSPTPIKISWRKPVSFGTPPPQALGVGRGMRPNTLLSASKGGVIVINQPTLTLDPQAPWHRPRPCKKVAK